ncbi:MAG: VCBS repeat-containing protein [Sediminicola sp.]
MRLRFFLLCLGVVSCAKHVQNKGEALYTTHCARCHTLPKVQHLTKELWKNTVLPEMGARMGIQDSTYDPYKGYSHTAQYGIRESGVFDPIPTLSREDWNTLQEYVIALAPEKLPGIVGQSEVGPLESFAFKPLSIDSVPGAAISFLDHDTDHQGILIGTLDGQITAYDPPQGVARPLFTAPDAVTGFSATNRGEYITAVGTLNPSQQKTGSILLRQGHRVDTLATGLHRPVHTLVHDLNKDGEHEIIVSEFGHLTGQLSLLQKGADGVYEKKMLVQGPGAMRAIVRDLNKDGKDDIIFLKAQGDEYVMALYQKDDLTFSKEILLRFSPLFGSSWFEMVDFDKDGYEDIITVHGDNADKTQILKPYHGMRIHLNNGKNEYHEAFFYPMYGATGSATYDYDQDGDLDIALVSTFPDYRLRPVKSFVYLENTGKGDFNFKVKVLPTAIDGKWFLIKAADVDADGDQDILLSAFTYYFTPIPQDLAQKWRKSSTDLLLLENKLH